MKTTPAQRRRARKIQEHDVHLLTRLADRLNAAAQPRRTDPIVVAYRYLRRFSSLLGWHRGASHVARYNFGPMLYLNQHGKLAVDPREAAT